MKKKREREREGEKERKKERKKVCMKRKREQKKGGSKVKVFNPFSSLFALQPSSLKANLFFN